MKAVITYRREEVEELVLARIAAEFPPPVGYRWEAKTSYSDQYECTLVEIQPAEGGPVAGAVTISDVAE